MLCTCNYQFRYFFFCIKCLTYTQIRHFKSTFPEGDFCLSFYYSMVGTDVGDFKVVLYDSANWNFRFKLTRSGPQIGGEWLKYEETVTMYTNTYVSVIKLVNIWLVLNLKFGWIYFWILWIFIKHFFRSFYFTVLTLPKLCT